jgi:preprotein translocase subunit SecA
MYNKLAGMTGTAETEAAEFASTYALEVVPIPTNVPMIREDLPDLVFKTEEVKFKAVVEDLTERYETGQPVLVGTASVEKSELLSRLLDKQGIPHSVLNAKYHAREATIVAQAGRLHAVTVATNMAGRGVDIVLGGNPEALARDEVIAEGLDPTSEEGLARYSVLFEKHAAECSAEGDEVRAVGGVYVLGSERHESRRIDNQLRGRSGRQGDPGESRFFLSLEDELMRLFATGAMNWVMEKALPDEMPIEARMVTRAIERAQNTVEQKNAEVRKDVLKYDEVMNEQRKVIYERRMQILSGEDLGEYTAELFDRTLTRVVNECCPRDFAEEWDLERLISEATLYYPTQFSVADLRQAISVEQVLESVLGEALEYIEERERTFPGGEEMARNIERQIMLQIIDQRWRLHLLEMDHLREGIHLRGIAQTDPLVAWQREGFELFGKLMESIDDEYLRYVAHVQVLPTEESTPDYTQAVYDAAEDPVAEFAPDALVPGGALEEAPAGRAQARVQGGGAVLAPASLAGVARTPQSKIGRNDPCWCGSGRKYKLCHGAS